MTNSLDNKSVADDMSKLTAAVGKGGRNHKRDVEKVQVMLLLHGYKTGCVDGSCGKRTINAILAFQKTHRANPDGLIDPAGETWTLLCKTPSTD
jgi:peptidoglycan hydrolase-like protein with peptidoglycan-binding domain